MGPIKTTTANRGQRSWARRRGREKVAHSHRSYGHSQSWWDQLGAHRTKPQGPFGFRDIFTPRTCDCILWLEGTGHTAFLGMKQ